MREYNVKRGQSKQDIELTCDKPNRRLGDMKKRKIAEGYGMIRIVTTIQNQTHALLMLYIGGVFLKEKVLDHRFTFSASLPK